MSNRINLEQLTSDFNKYRMSHQEERYTNVQLVGILNELGFNKNIAHYLISKYFDVSRINNLYLYNFRKTPVHMNAIKLAYEHYRSKRTKKLEQSEDKINEAIDLLLKTGNYRISQMKKFDEERFAKEQPEIYKKYLIYEEL